MVDPTPIVAAGLSILEDDFARVADALPGLVWTARPDGTPSFVNRRWRAYAGIDAGDASAAWQLLAHPDDLPGLLESWLRIVSSGQPGETQARLRRRDGTFRWFRMSTSPARDEEGSITQWYGVGCDIDDLVEEGKLHTRQRDDHPRAASAPRSVELDLHAMIDTIPMTAWSALPDGYCDFVNQRWLDYVGVTLEETIGWGWGVAIHPDDLPALTAQWQRCLATGEPMHGEARMRRFDGAYRWFLFLGDPLRDPAGNIVKWFGTNVDVEDRKRAEEALRESERNLIQIINTIPTTAWSTRPDGYCDFLSDRWLDYAGYTLEQAVGWNWSAVIHPDDADGLFNYWKGCLANGTPVDTLARMRRFDGEYRWFLFRANPLRDAAGNIVKWFGTNVDVEDRRRAEDALRASERNLVQIINTIPTTAWSTRPDGYCDFLSDRWLDYAGFGVEQAAGWNWSSVIHPEDVAGLFAHWKGCLETGALVDTEARMRRYDGKYRWFLFRAAPLRDAEGNIVKWFGSNVDIEDRKLAEEKLRRSEVLLAEGQRVSQTGSFYWRVDTDEITASDEFYRILDLPLASPVTLDRVADRVHPEDVALLYDKVSQARAGGEDLDYESRLRMRDGSYKNLRITAYPSLDAEGGLEYVGSIQDVTERRRSEEALTQVRSELAYMTRVASMGVLTASIAHEVNQPLTGIINNCSACQHLLAANPPDVKAALETVRRSIRDSHRASDVIKRLRALFAKQNTATEAVDINEAAREVIALSMSELQRNRVSLRAEFCPALPLVKGDRIQLQQVILNLLMNGSAALSTVDDRPRQLQVRTERSADGGLQLSVQDNGVGIGEVDADRLFEAFYTTKSQGLGIGLSVSRTIVENHGGRLWAHANDGPGAIFTLSLPGVETRDAGPAEGLENPAVTRRSDDAAIPASLHIDRIQGRSEQRRRRDV
ncbi:PAS domain-containing sensor histidine kinase [Variovorax sp. GT1P44]|uniref:PAS domain-containing sensor histidine kinase n=1 Tax=Variovorax sp. GT1P44 TaxID=3443742 RepID=UPI003F463932